MGERNRVVLVEDLGDALDSHAEMLGQGWFAMLLKVIIKKFGLIGARGEKGIMGGVEAGLIIFEVFLKGVKADHLP